LQNLYDIYFWGERIKKVKIIKIKERGKEEKEKERK
jgi:hypothetical protein